MPNMGYDPTGTGLYAVGGFYNGLSGVNVINDGSGNPIKYYGDVANLTDVQRMPLGTKPQTAGLSGTSAGYSGSSFQNKIAVKIGTSEPLVTEQSMSSVDQITQELFEDLSLDEIMTMGRSETVLGMNITYQPIKNVASIYFQYNPKSILALAGVAESESQEIGIDISKHLIDNPIAVDPTTGEIVIGFKNLNSSDRIEVEMISSGDIITTS